MIWPLSAGFAIGQGVTSAIGAFALAKDLANPYQALNNPLQAAMNEQRQAISTQQDLYDEQADLALSESKLAAIQKAQETREFESKQAALYDQSGVTLSGSPLAVMDYTRRQSQQELDMITKQGQAQADFMQRSAAVMAENQQAQLLGDQSRWITEQAQTKIMGGQNAQIARQQGFRDLGQIAQQGFSLLGT